MLSVTAYVFRPCDRQLSSVYIEFVHTGESFFTRFMYTYMYPKHSVVSQWTWFDVGFTAIVYFLGTMQI